MRRWYVVSTHRNAEHKAAWHLGNQGFHNYLPRYLKRRRHARRADTVWAPLFPRYLFVELDLERDRWRTVLSTIGISHLIMNCDGPVPLPIGVVESIRAREDDDGLVPVARETHYRRGDAVRIVVGALCDRVGLFECVSDQDRVVLLLELLGREVRVRVPVETVAAYG